MINSQAGIPSGFNHTFMGGAAVAAATAWNKGLSGGVENALTGSIIAGFAEEAQARRYAHAQQNTSRGLPNLASGLDELLRRGDCGSFVQNLINQVAKSTGNPFLSDYLPDLVNGVVIDFSQQYDSRGRKVAGRAYPEDETGFAFLGISPNNYSPAAAAYTYVETFLH